MIPTVFTSLPSGALCLGLQFVILVTSSSVGTLIATLIRDWVRAANEHSINFEGCDSAMIRVRQVNRIKHLGV